LTLLSGLKEKKSFNNIILFAYNYLKNMLFEKSLQVLLSIQHYEMDGS